MNYIIRITLVGLIGLVSCLGVRSSKNETYLGNFKEQQYPFFESIRFVSAHDKFFSNPFDYKFGGIPPNSLQWLRNADNLWGAFTTAKTIGLEKFITKEQYHTPDFSTCCGNHWDGKSLNEIIKRYLRSDTNATVGYHAEFWKRRKAEGTMTVTYKIMSEINDYYNGTALKASPAKVDSTLFNLLEMNVKLLAADSSSYNKTSLEYFNYLKKAGLEHSAYKLIFHNPKSSLSKKTKDSLLLTLKVEKISQEEWNAMDGNARGWMTARDFKDPKKPNGQ